MILRREFLASACGAMAAAKPVPVLTRQALDRTPVRSFCIDFNWEFTETSRGESATFARPGHWADASPSEHVRWYRDLGANVIQTFAVSCNGYAWYKGGFVPPQPGLRHDFLTEMVRLGHQRGMWVMAYFCAGANSKWGHDHPGLSYGTPSAPHIPFTNEYLDYLCRSMADAMQKTGIDGYMVDWLWNPGANLRKNGWLPAEKSLYSELMKEAFPANGSPSASAITEFDRRAIDRCWNRIRETRNRVKPDCVLWLSVSNLDQPAIANSPVLKECDWVLNENSDVSLLDAGKKMIGKRTRIIQNLVGWQTHNAEAFLKRHDAAKLDLYGFAAPRPNSLPLPVSEYLSRPVDSFRGTDRFSVNDRNIAALARFYNR